MRGCLAPSLPESRPHPQRSPGPSGHLEVSRSLRRKRPPVLSSQGQPGTSPVSAGVDRDRPRRRTPSRSRRLEFAATASPASTGGRAPGRALGAPRLQEAYFVAVASDSSWQFGLARKTSLRDRHAVRLSKLPDVVSVGTRVTQRRQTVAPLARRSQVSSLSAGEATRRQSSDTDVSARMPSSRIRMFSSACHGGQTAASSSAANRSDGLPNQLDRAENRGDHDHDRCGDAYGQNVIQHGRRE